MSRAKNGVTGGGVAHDQPPRHPAPLSSHPSKWYATAAKSGSSFPARTASANPVRSALDTKLLPVPLLPPVVDMLN